MHLSEIVVFDEEQDCAYLPGRCARLPHRFPLSRLEPDELDQRLADGDRRSGLLLYRPQCPRCRACEAIRLDLDSFRPNATHRRILRAGDRQLSLCVGPPQVDKARVELFNKHRRLRNLEHGDGSIDEEGYVQFLAESCCDTWEFSYYLQGALACVAIADVGRCAMSAVYCFYDPDLSRLSLGTYSILKQVQWCLESERRYLYLGLYIAQSPHMSYKARFHPHERLIGGAWRRFG